MVGDASLPDRAGERGDHPLLLLGGDLGEEREGEHLVRGRLRRREVPALVAEVAEGALEMDRHRVVHAGADTCGVEAPENGVAPGYPDYIEMPDRLVAGKHGGPRHARIPGEQLVVASSGRAPRRIPLRQVGQLRVQDDRLECVQPRVEPELGVRVFHLAAVVAERAHLAGDGVRVGEYGARVAVGPEVLGWVEARPGCDPEAACGNALLRRPVSLRRVLQQEDPSPLSERPEPLHRRELAVEVDGEDGSRARPDPPGYLLDVDQVVDGVTVDQRRRRARAHDGERSGDERVRGHDDLVFRPDPDGAQGELERVRAVTYPNAVADAGEAGESLLERRHVLAEDEGGGGEDAGEALLDLRRDLAVLRRKIDEGVRGQGCTGSSRAPRSDRSMASRVRTTSSPSRPPLRHAPPDRTQSRK